jgi:hypothetical protein
VTIYMLSGQAVFSTSDPAEAYRQRQDAPPLIDAALRSADVPAAVSALFARACELDPDLRPPSAGTFARALADAFERKGARRLPLPSPALDSLGAIAERARAPSSSPPPAAPPLHLTPATLPLPVGLGPRTAPPALDAPRPPEPPGRPAVVRPVSPRAGTLGVSGRTTHFVPLLQGVADVADASGGARLRLTLVPTSGQSPAVHLRGLNCFVAKDGGRPSGATQLEVPGEVEFLAPDRRTLGRAQIVFASPSGDQLVLVVGGEAIGVALAEATQAIALDFGHGAECLIAYVPRVVSGAGEARRVRE